MSPPSLPAAGRLKSPPAPEPPPLLAFAPEAYAVHTKVYDGPLELLLYLIRRDGIDVRDIPIHQVTQEYLRYLDLMVEMDLDVAGDFLVMAATLCMLKSRELLPRHDTVDDEEEELDPAEELARRLLNYQRFKEAAEQLAARQMLGRDVFARPSMKMDPKDRPVDPTVDAFGLLEAFYRVIKKAAEEPPTHEIELEQYSMAERVRWILEQLEGGANTLHELYLHIHGRAARILSFLALLEMAKLQFLDISQEHHMGPVKLTGLVASADVDLDKLPEISEGAG